MLEQDFVRRWDLTIAFMMVAGAATANPAAEKLFQDGRTALANKQIDAACDAFRASEQLEPRVGTLLNLGDCEEQRKRVASAWNAFIDAQNLAVKDGDPARGAEAGRRAKVLEARLPYVTLAVTRTPGLVIKRDGAEVPTAEWDRELPIDPRTYELTATAPGYEPWAHRFGVDDAQHISVAVPVLVAVVEPVPIEPLGVIVQPEPPPKLAWRLAPGVLVGVDDNSDPVFAVRLVANIMPFGPGTIRVVPSVLYEHAQLSDSADHTQTTYAAGATIEYAYPWIANRIILAGGVGAGLDRFLDSYSGLTTTNPFGMVRLSPTVRFYDRADLGFHYQLTRVAGNFVNLFEVGIDFYVW
jgi:hypothetical protein